MTSTAIDDSSALERGTSVILQVGWSNSQMKDIKMGSTPRLIASMWAAQAFEPLCKMGVLPKKPGVAHETIG